MWCTLLNNPLRALSSVHNIFLCHFIIDKKYYSHSLNNTGKQCMIYLSLDVIYVTILQRYNFWNKISLDNEFSDDNSLLLSATLIHLNLREGISYMTSLFYRNKVWVAFKIDLHVIPIIDKDWNSISAMH